MSSHAKERTRSRKEQVDVFDSDPILSWASLAFVGLRRKIAEKMALAKSRIPHITYVEEVDVTESEAPDVTGAWCKREALRIDAE